MGLGDLSLERQASDLALDGWVCQSVSEGLKRRGRLTLGEQRPGDERGKAKEMERKGWWGRSFPPGLSNAVGWRKLR